VPSNCWPRWGSLTRARRVNHYPHDFPEACASGSSLPWPSRAIPNSLIADEPHNGAGRHDPGPDPQSYESVTGDPRVIDCDHHPRHGCHCRNGPPGGCHVRRTSGGDRTGNRRRSCSPSSLYLGPARCRTRAGTRSRRLATIPGNAISPSMSRGLRVSRRDVSIAWPFAWSDP